MRRSSSVPLRLLLALSAGAGLGAAAIQVPPFAPALAMLSFALVDGVLASFLGPFAAPPARRVVTRGTAAGILLGLMSLLVAAHGSARWGSWTLPLCAIVATAAFVVGTYGSLRTPNAAGPTVGLVDLGTSAFVLLAALSAHEAPSSRRATVAVTMGVVGVLRGLSVVTLVARGAREGDATMLPALGFLGWLAVAATLCTLAASPVAWSGLGAATVLTLAAVLVERRQRRVIVVFFRGALAFSAAAMLGAVSLLA
ncbi:MAG: hypothetical protein JNL79_34630 [Myxococcales bacterium]|nr:hypothetical protein [Myxococcales bacterium]